MRFHTNILVIASFALLQVGHVVQGDGHGGGNETATSNYFRFTGYLADMLCTRLEIAPDTANMLLNPIEHTVRCQLLPACLRSGYGLIQNIGSSGDNLYRISAAFDEAGNDFVADLLMTMDTTVNDLRVAVEGSFMGLAPATETPSITSRDGQRFWPAMNDIPTISVDSLQFCNYQGPDAKMVLKEGTCDSHSVLDLLTTSEGRSTLANANLCMRDEIVIFSAGNSATPHYLVNPDGCADHATFRDVKKADPETCSQAASGGGGCDDDTCDQDVDTCSRECLDSCGNGLVDGCGNAVQTCCLDSCGNALVNACGLPLYDDCGNPLTGSGETCPVPSIGENQVNECLDGCGSPLVDACGSPVTQCCLDGCGNPLVDPCGIPLLDGCGNPGDESGNSCPASSLGANVCLPSEAVCDGECAMECIDVCGNPITLSSGRPAISCCVDGCGVASLDPCGFPLYDLCGNPTYANGTACPATSVAENEVNECVDGCGSPLVDACGNPVDTCCINGCGSPYVDTCGFPTVDPCGNPITGEGGATCPAEQTGMNACEGGSSTSSCTMECFDSCGNPLTTSSGRAASSCCLDGSGGASLDPCGFPLYDTCGNPTLADSSACPAASVGVNEINECVDGCGSPLVDACGNPADTCCINGCGSPYVDGCGFPTVDGCGNPIEGEGGARCPLLQLGENACVDDAPASGGGSSWRRGRSRRSLSGVVSKNSKKRSSSHNKAKRGTNSKRRRRAAATTTTTGIRQMYIANHNKIVMAKRKPEKRKSRKLAGHEGGGCHKECVDACGNPIPRDISQRPATTCCLDDCGNPLLNGCGFPFYDGCGNPTSGYSGEACAPDNIGEYDANECVDACGSPLVDACGSPVTQCCLDGCGNPLVDPCGIPLLDGCGNPGDESGNSCTATNTGENACPADFESGCARGCIDVCGSPLVDSNGRTSRICCLDACGSPVLDPCGFPLVDQCGNPLAADGGSCPDAMIANNQVNDCLDVCGSPLVDACGNPVDQCCLDTCGNPHVDPCGIPYLDACGNPSLPSGEVCPADSIGANVCSDEDGDGDCVPTTAFPPAAGSFQCQGLVSPCQLVANATSTDNIGVPPGSFTPQRRSRARRMQGEPTVPLYTPLSKDLQIKIPTTQTMLRMRKDLDPNNAGVIGVAVNGVPIVYEHPGEGGNTLLFDSCGGHGDLENRYHYHLPPICLLRSLGGTVPRVSDWWLAPNPETQWPSHAKSFGDISPLVGWAIDGSPIFGPYSPDNGELVVTSGGAGDAECTTNVLDECNGMVLENGVYAYFLTPTAPFVPPCLMGDIPDGAFVDNGLKDDVIGQCPFNGTDPLAGTEICDEKSIVFEDASCPGNADRQSIRNCFELATSSFVGEPTCAQMEYAIAESKSCFLGVGCCGDLVATMSAWMMEYPRLESCNFVDIGCIAFEDDNIVSVTVQLGAPVADLVPDTKASLRKALASLLMVEPSQIQVTRVTGTETSSQVVFQVAYPTRDDAMAAAEAIDTGALSTSLASESGLTVSSLEAEHMLPPVIPELWSKSNKVGFGLSMAAILVLLGILVFLEDVFCIPGGHGEEEAGSMKETDV